MTDNYNQLIFKLKQYKNANFVYYGKTRMLYLKGLLTVHLNMQPSY